MNDAEAIIERLSATYPCSREGCDGTAAMTVDRGGSELFYRCDGCGHTWRQDGTPRGWTS